MSDSNLIVVTTLKEIAYSIRLIQKRFQTMYALTK